MVINTHLNGPNFPALNLSHYFSREMLETEAKFLRAVQIQTLNLAFDVSVTSTGLVSGAGLEGERNT